MNRLVEFERLIGWDCVDLVEDLERLLGAKVDLLTPTGVDTIRNPNTAARIRESAVYV